MVLPIRSPLFAAMKKMVFAIKNITTKRGTEKMQKKLTGWIGGATALLAVMGLTFLWMCPEWRSAGAGAEHLHFWRQLFWNMAGGGAMIMAIWIGWRRWLKVAPWLFVAWIGLCGLAFAFLSVGGRHEWIPLGVCSLNVWTLFPLALSLLLARLAVKGRVRSVIVLTLIALMAFFALQIVGSPERMERLAAWFHGTANAVPMSEQGCLARARLDQYLAAFSASRWFSGCDLNMCWLPYPASAGASCAAAVVFGKWFVLTGVVLFCAWGAGLLAALLGTKDSARRMFIGVWGFCVLGLAAHSFLSCTGIMPTLTFCVPLISYGGFATLATWTGVGIVMSSLLAKDEAVCELGASRVCGITALAALPIVLSVFALRYASSRDLTFKEWHPDVDRSQTANM